VIRYMQYGKRYNMRFVVGVGVRRTNGSLVFEWSGHPRTQTEADAMKALQRLIAHFYYS
jgi:hypothetical protein